jgi:hypothetical protein
MSASSDFESELDEYIDNRRDRERRKRRGFFKRLFSSWRRDDAQESRSPEEQEMEAIEDDIEVIDEEERELEETRESLLTRFFKLLRSDTVEEPVESVEDDEDDVVVEAEPEVVDKELVKEAIKIQHKWIEELPAKELSRFKRHDDYERYQELLDELELIK